MRTNGTLWAWGRNDDGQLGIGSKGNEWTPVQVGDRTDWASARGGGWSTYAVRTDGTLWSWGWNVYGQLGNGTKTDVTIPTQVTTPAGWVSVHGGQYHAIGTLADGSVYAWGTNWYGELGPNGPVYPQVDDSADPILVFPPSAPLEVPGVPVLVAPQHTRVSTANVSWAAVDGADTYEWRLNGGSWTETANLGATVGPLIYGANTVEVRAVNAAGAGEAASATVCWVRPAEPNEQVAIPPTVVTPPATVNPPSVAPAQIRITKAPRVIGTPSKAKLSWTSASGATGYQVFRATTAKGKYRLVATTAGRSVVTKGLKPRTRYYYKVRAYRLVNGMRVFGPMSKAAVVR